MWLHLNLTNYICKDSVSKCHVQRTSGLGLQLVFFQEGIFQPQHNPFFYIWIVITSLCFIGSFGGHRSQLPHPTHYNFYFYFFAGFFPSVWKLVSTLIFPSLPNFSKVASLLCLTIFALAIWLLSRLFTWTFISSHLWCHTYRYANLFSVSLLLPLLLLLSSFLIYCKCRHSSRFCPLPFSLHVLPVNLITPITSVGSMSMFPKYRSLILTFTRQQAHGLLSI